MQNIRIMGFEIKRMDNAIRRHLNGRLVDKGFDEVTIMHGWIIGYLYKNQDRDIFQKDIENDFGIARSSVTNILKLMEKKGYVTRTSIAKDARLKKLELTPLGLKVQLETMRIIDGMHEDMEKGITNEEREIFFSVMEKMRNNMEIADKKEEG